MSEPVFSLRNPVKQRSTEPPLDHIFEFDKTPEPLNAVDPVAIRTHDTSDQCRATVPVQIAKRDRVNVRYDILNPSFLQKMAQVAALGAAKYGEYNWQKSRLIGEDSPINHMHIHLNAYSRGERYDHSEIGITRKEHLVAIAFNAMMEYWYEENSITY